MIAPKAQHRSLLLRVARREMLEHGLTPDFPPEALAEAEAIPGPASQSGEGIRDLRNLLWCSIDNDDSLDLDQLTVANPEPASKGTRVLVAISRVSALVAPGSALDEHAVANTTSVYTPAKVFPMLPERLSTDLTSLNEDKDRLAIAVEFTVDEEGAVVEFRVDPAIVRNRAKLAYSGVGPWLEGPGQMPPAVTEVPGLAENLRIQDDVAQRLKTRPARGGAS